MATKTARIDLRLFSDQKKMIAQAAAMEGKDTSSFVADNALQKAREVIERENIIRISLQDMMKVSEILNCEAGPNQNLKNAAKKFKEKYG